MTAVHTMPLPADLGQSGQRRRIILLPGRGSLIGQGVFQLLQRARSAQDCRHRRTRKRVVQAFIRRQRLPGRRKCGAQQVASAEGLHHRDAHAPPLASLVKRLPLRVHIDQWPGIALRRPETLHILVGRQQVVAGVDTEHQHIDFPALHRQPRRRGVVAGQPDRPCPSLASERLCVAHHLAALHGVPVAYRIHVVDHGDIHP